MTASRMALATMKQAKRPYIMYACATCILLLIGTIFFVVEELASDQSTLAFQWNLRQLSPKDLEQAQHIFTHVLIVLLVSLLIAVLLIFPRLIKKQAEHYRQAFLLGVSKGKLLRMTLVQLLLPVLCASFLVITLLFVFQDSFEGLVDWTVRFAAGSSRQLRGGLYAIISDKQGMVILNVSQQKTSSLLVIIRALCTTAIATAAGAAIFAGCLYCASVVHLKRR